MLYVFAIGESQEIFLSQGRKDFIVAAPKNLAQLHIPLFQSAIITPDKNVGAVLFRPDKGLFQINALLGRGGGIAHAHIAAGLQVSLFSNEGLEGIVRGSRVTHAVPAVIVRGEISD